MTASLTIPVSIAKDLLTGAEWSPADTRRASAAHRGHQGTPVAFRLRAARKHIALIFEKPSLRTRVTFEVGIQSMGGDVVFLDHTQARLGERESIPMWPATSSAGCRDRRACLRATRPGEMAASINIPVVNALSDKFHPCQALADYFTLEEKFGNLKGLKIAYVGDGNNVCHSLLILAARLGVNLRIAAPAITLPRRTSSRTPSVSPGKPARASSCSPTQRKPSSARKPSTPTPGPAWLRGRRKVRRNVFKAYQVNRKLMEQAAPGAFFMHCLPAHRGAEVTDEVLDGPTSIVLKQSENRMYVQKAILHALYS